jgi:hypothetical protein
MTALIDILIGFIAAMVSAALVHFGAADTPPSHKAKMDPVPENAAEAAPEKAYTPAQTQTRVTIVRTQSMTTADSPMAVAAPKAHKVTAH